MKTLLQANRASTDGKQRDRYAKNTSSFSAWIIPFLVIFVFGFFCFEEALGQNWSATRNIQNSAVQDPATNNRQLETLPPPDQFIATPPSQESQHGPMVEQVPGSHLYPNGQPIDMGCATGDCYGAEYRPGILFDGPIRQRLRNRPLIRSRFGYPEQYWAEGDRYLGDRPVLGGIRRGEYSGDQTMYRTDRPIRDFIFPIFPLFRQRWPSSPPLERPRSVWLNPFAIQQGLGNLIFRGNYPADTGALGFPYSMVPSHLVDRVPRPFFDLSRNQSQGRHIGRGNPFRDSSWSNRPVHFSWFTGVLFTGDLTDQTSSSNGLYNGFRIGWDFDHYWGSEFRYGFGAHNLQNRLGEVDIRTADISILYYPWGDSRWRPYTSMGVGFGTYEFLNVSGNAVDETTFQLPLGVGLKYAVRPWWAARIEAVNIFSFESGDVNFMNNVLLSGSIEIHFGGRRRMYFPFDAGPSGF